jgi:hypothetical protein
VIGPNELVEDHRKMSERLNLIGTDVVGYIYNHAPRQAVLSVSGATIQQRLLPESSLHGRPTTASSQPSPKG